MGATPQPKPTTDAQLERIARAASEMDEADARQIAALALQGLGRPTSQAEEAPNAHEVGTTSRGKVCLDTKEVRHVQKAPPD